MPIKKFDTVVVKNKTIHTRTLRSGDGDSVDIMPLAEAKVHKKFVTWQPPSKAHFRVLSGLDPVAPTVAPTVDLPAPQAEAPVKVEPEAEVVE